MQESSARKNELLRNFSDFGSKHRELSFYQELEKLEGSKKWGVYKSILRVFSANISKAVDFHIFNDFVVS